MEDSIAYVYTIGMTEAEVHETLEESETGVLALADDNVAYAIPISQYFDGRSLFFRLGADGDSRKLAFVDATDEACFVCHGVDAPDDSWSVLAEGPIERVDHPTERGFDDTTANERFGSLRVFDEAIEAVDLVLFELRIEQLAGRRTTV